MIFVPDTSLTSPRALLDLILHYGTTRMVFVRRSSLLCSRATKTLLPR